MTPKIEPRAFSYTYLTHSAAEGHTLQLSTFEQQRLASLRELDILDTEREPEFDDIVRLAAAVCGASIGIVSLLDEDRSWFKACFGVDATQAPRSVAFCEYTIRQTDLLLVEDAREDERFSSNPLVTGDAHVRFYAGFPVTSPDGHAVGSLCVVDMEPRKLDEDQKTTLRILAGQVSSRMELRLKRRQLEQALAEKEQALAEKEQERAHASALQQRFQQFMDNSPFVSYIRDADGRLLYYNQPLANQFNVTMDEWLGKTSEELWPAEDAAMYRKNDLAVMESGQLHVSQETSTNPDGTLASWRSYKFPCKDEHGNLLLGGVSVNVTEQLQRQQDLERLHKEVQQANLLLQQLACIDTLTGLSVRRVFDDELSVRFRDAKTSGKPVCVLLLDVDDFKLHNDQYGHPHGDRVLQALGTCLCESLRPTDLVARYGGEEFAILLGDESAANVPRIVDRLLDNVRALTVDGVRITVSGGICSSSHETGHPKQLVSNADVALFAAKRTGKNRAVLFEDCIGMQHAPFCPGDLLPRTGVAAMQ